VTGEYSIALREYFDILKHSFHQRHRNFKISSPILIQLVTFAEPLSDRRRYYGARRLCVCLCVRPTATARRISLGGEGNALYPVLSSFSFYSVLISEILIIFV